MDEIRAIAIVVVASVVAAGSTPLVILLARRLGVVDRPSERKVSRRKEMPLLGGLAVGLGCAAGLVTAGLLSSSLPAGVTGFATGGALLLAVGAWDDRYTMPAPWKLGFQIAAAVIAVEAGFRVDLFSDPITSHTFVVPLWIVWPVSLLWIVGVTNAMNLIDGLDGLAAGVGAIIAATLTVICWQAGQWTGVVIGLALFGSLIGYLPYNFPPARIFLGDTGSLFIGFGLALLALEGYRKAAFLAFLVPILALAIPLLDTLLSIVRRLRSGRGVFSPDRLHMHHRLLVREGSHKNAVLMLYFLTACFCMIAVSFSQLDGWLAFIYLAAVVAVTIRLLRNLDAFSLEVHEEAPPDPATGIENRESEGTVAREEGAN
ncbi:MAG TPA: undecaprenyl/decaprenyl-phosphate alpha-N-acetylglucosaminyl 1-phosphate transferase [Deltaproteobacteria bacterium]|nr:undecaprenyl/decaprenyl-phosphate alpha-N-acetylglucosaminyl 1-phosphate transferase [Deltaproteobacteria bacterium]